MPNNISCFDGPGQPAGGDIDLSLTASRTSGVAPLLVHFSTQGTSAVSSTDPFHDLSYCWDFDDGQVGVFNTTGLSKNVARGPVAGHVFRTPGTYVVTLAARDSNNSEALQQVTITVEDPETVFAGKTVCFSSTGNFSGCPAGATQVTGTDISELQAYVTAGTRILLARGQSFSVDGEEGLSINVPGPGIVGAYGEGARPLINTSGFVFPLSHGNPDNAQFDDWRIMDLEIQGDGEPASGLAGGHNLTNFLALNLVADDLGAYIGVSNQGGDVIGIQDCHFTDLLGGDEPEKDGGGRSMAYITATRLMMLGNYYNNSTESEHVLRIRFTQDAVLSSNDLGRANGPRLLLKLHGYNWETESFEYAENILISDNIFRGTDEHGWMVFLGPASNDEQRLRNLVVERNQFIRAHTGVNIPLLIQAENVTVRNNLFRSTVGGGQYTAISLYKFGAGAVAKNIRILHNTASSVNETTPVRLLSFVNTSDPAPAVAAENVEIFNNLIFSSDSTVLMNTPGGGNFDVPDLTHGGNILTQDLPFVSATQEDWESFDLLPDSEPVNAADEAHSARWDFLGRSRDDTPDVGAFEYFD